jgi:hypothetical protein
VLKAWCKRERIFVISKHEEARWMDEYNYKKSVGFHKRTSSFVKKRLRGCGQRLFTNAGKDHLRCIGQKPPSLLKPTYNKDKEMRGCDTTSIMYQDAGQRAA